MAAQRPSKNILPFAESVRALIEPICKALDANANAGTDRDNGQDLPSMKDPGLRILLDSWIRPLHRNLEGDGKNRQGFVSDAWKRSQEQRDQLMAEYQGREEELEVLPRAMTIAHWFEVNRIRFEAYNEAYTSLRQLYREVTGETWKFTELEQRTLVQNDALKAKVASVFSKAGEQTLIKKQA